MTHRRAGGLSRAVRTTIVAVLVGCGGEAAHHETTAGVDIDPSSTDSQGETTHAGTGDPSRCAVGDGPAREYVAAPPGTLLLDPLAPFPDDLADLGVYPRLPDLSVVADVAVHYVPRWPLWTNGSDKHRYLVLPEGTRIDTSDPDAWIFPAGTLLFKTFLYDDGPEGCMRPVETRVLRKAEDDTWDYAAYRWDSRGEGATLLPGNASTPIEVMGDDGPFQHHVPAKVECRTCHESSPHRVLGFETLQLSAPLPGEDAMQLATLGDQAIFSDPVKPRLVEHPDPLTVEVLGLFQGNCVHCHNGSGGPSSSFDLRPEVALANTIGQPTEGSGSASGIRIVPGDPAASVLFQAFSGETNDPEVKLMPPLGVDVRDAASIELLRSFIFALEP